MVMMKYETLTSMAILELAEVENPPTFSIPPKKNWFSAFKKIEISRAGLVQPIFKFETLKLTFAGYFKFWKSVKFGGIPGVEL